MKWKVEFLERDPLKELIEKRRERRARIVRELLELRTRERELEKELYEEAVELLKHIDDEDRIIHVGVSLSGWEFLTRRGKIIFVDKDGSIIVQARNGTYIVGQGVVLL